MSHTTLHTFDAKGDICWGHDYKNSHGSASAIWGHLCDRYFAGRFFMDATNDLWKLANRDGMEPWERMTCWTTYDKALIAQDDIAAYADAMEKFAAQYGPRSHERGHVFHVPEIAGDLRGFIGYDDVVAVGFTQTSVASDVWDPEMTDARRLALVRAGLPGLTADAQTLVAAFLDDWWAEDSGEYNLNIDTDHVWLPSGPTWSKAQHDGAVLSRGEG